jgi:hypothetical protein
VKIVDPQTGHMSPASHMSASTSGTACRSMRLRRARS